MATIKSSTEHLVLNADGASKDIKFQANGVEVASIDSTGALTVAGLTSTGIDDNATSTAITIDASENVGIGTSSPASLATVSSGVNTETRTLLVDNAHSGGSMYNAFGVYVGETDRKVTLSADYNDSIMAFRTNGSERMRIDSSGNVLVGTPPTMNSERVRIKNNNSSTWGLGIGNTDGSNTTGCIGFSNSNGLVGSILTSGSSTTYATSSDYRLKENVLPMTGSIDRLKALKPSNFNFIADATTTVDGFLAHEAGEVVPECVTGTKDAMKDEEYEVTPAVMDGDTIVTEAVMGTRSVPDYQGIDQSKLVPLLVASLQEAIARIEVLENA